MADFLLLTIMDPKAAGMAAAVKSEQVLWTSDAADKVPQYDASNPEIRAHAWPRHVLPCGARAGGGGGGV